MSVWITRSAPDNLRTARELRGLGQINDRLPRRFDIKEVYRDVRWMPLLETYNTNEH